MAGGFAIDTNRPIVDAGNSAHLHDIETFKERLLKAGIPEMYVSRDAEAWLGELALEEIPAYIARRRVGYSHPEVIRELRSPY
jgi:hypothetical protein